LRRVRDVPPNVSNDQRRTVHLPGHFTHSTRIPFDPGPTIPFGIARLSPRIGGRSGPTVLGSTIRCLVDLRIRKQLSDGVHRLPLTSNCHLLSTCPWQCAYDSPLPPTGVAGGVARLASGRTTVRASDRSLNCAVGETGEDALDAAGIPSVNPLLCDSGLQRSLVPLLVVTPRDDSASLRRS
jgi:hypothetical protein